MPSRWETVQAPCLYLALCLGPGFVAACLVKICLVTRCTHESNFVQIQLPPDARNLMDRLLCDVDDRLGSNGIQELKVRINKTWQLTACCLADLDALMSAM